MVTRLRQFAGLMVICYALALTNAAAQGARVRPFEGDRGDANQTRLVLQGLLSRHPPFLREVLRLDPSLLTNEEFLKAYPEVSDFLTQHPEIHEDHSDAWLDARIPSSGLVWWRAELRARQAARRTAERPITFVQALGGACAAGTAFALIVQAWP